VPYRFIKQLAGPDQDFLEVIARLKPGVPLEEAQKEITAVWKSLPQATPRALTLTRIELRSIRNGASYLREQFRTALIALMVGTAFLLLMVCSNVGGLLLARSAARSKETAVRLALGATRVQIVAQWGLESLVLTFSGGVSGAALAYVGIPLLMRWMPRLPLNSFDLRTFSVDVRISVRVIVFAFASCGITAILSAIGLYGALAFYVAQRQQELGLRLALGASTLHVIKTVLRRIGPLLIGGLASGLAVYFLTGRWMQTLFFGIGFADPVFISTAVVMLMGTAAAAAAVPIYRALHFDAASILKQE
jgi:ABC-type antimicrobial peptide transport system permease subunit